MQFKVHRTCHVPDANTIAKVQQCLQILVFKSVGIMTKVLLENRSFTKKEVPRKQKEKKNK